MGCSLAERPEHRQVLELLAAMNRDLLAAKARGAYGDAVDRAFAASRKHLRDDAFRRHCFDALGLTDEARRRAERVLSR